MHEKFSIELLGIMLSVVLSSSLPIPSYIPVQEISPIQNNCKDSFHNKIMSVGNQLKLIADHHNKMMSVANRLKLTPDHHDTVKIYGKSLLSDQAGVLNNYDKCINTRESKMKYCVFDLEINTFTDIGVQTGSLKLQMGLCIPSVCSKEDVNEVITNNSKTVHTDKQGKQCIQITKQGRKASCSLTNIDYDMITIFTCALIVIITGLVVLASILDVFWHKKMKTREYGDYSFTITDLILAFSLKRSAASIFTPNLSKSPPIKAVHCIKVICMFWIILHHIHHTALLYPQVSSNPDYFKTLSTRFLYQPITNVTFAVDGFLFLSSLLSAYLTLKDIEKHGKFRYQYFYLQRYFRISPLSYFIVLFSFTIFPHLGSGPFWQAFDYHSCQKTWWTNIVYGVNFLSGDWCYGVTWYLAVDMQLYIISPIFIVLLYKMWYVGLAVTIMTMGGAVAIVGVIANSNGYYAAVSANPNHAYQIGNFYNKPYFRISPYLVGIIFGYILYKKNKIAHTDSSLKKRLMHTVLWSLAVFLCFSVVFGTYREWHGNPFGNMENVIFLMFSGIAWCTGLAIIIYCCNNKMCFGVVNTILSWSGWEILAKLTFGAYLSHMLVLYHIFGTFRSVVTFTDYLIAELFIITILKSYSVSLLTAVTIELPLSRVTSLCFTFLGIQTRRK